MFVDDGPIAAANALKGYLFMNLANSPAEAVEKLQPVAMNSSPADVLVVGMETLYSALLQCPDMPNKGAAWEAVGTAAQQVAKSNVWGKGERAFQVMIYANYKINGMAGDMAAPDVPELDEGYRVVAAPAVPTEDLPPVPAPPVPLPAPPEPG